MSADNRPLEDDRRLRKDSGGHRTAAWAGFTLVEALLSVVLLSLIASVVGSVYYSGLKTYTLQGETILVDSALRSKMEFLLSLEFSQLATGSESVTILGQSKTLSWTVTNVDLSGDGVVETTAKSLSVTLSGISLHTLVAHTSGQVFKL